MKTFAMLFVALGVQLHAAVITYTFTGTISGILNGVGFSKQSIQFVMDADLSTLLLDTSGGEDVFRETSNKATMTIGSGAPIAITEPLDISDNHTEPTLAFGTNNFVIAVSTLSSLFATYTLDASFGPLTPDHGGVGLNGPLATAGGPLTVFGFQPSSAAAALDDPLATPEPGTAAVAVGAALFFWLESPPNQTRAARGGGSGVRRCAGSRAYVRGFDHNQHDTHG